MWSDALELVHVIFVVMVVVVRGGSCDQLDLHRVLFLLDCLLWSGQCCCCYTPCSTHYRKISTSCCSDEKNKNKNIILRGKYQQ